MSSMAERLSPRVETRHLWYQVQYSRTAQDANDGLREESSRLDAARSRARELALVTATTLLDYGQWDPGRSAPGFRLPLGRDARMRRRLIRFLMDTVEPSTLILLAALNERRGVRRLEDRCVLARYLEDGAPIHPRALIRYVRRNENLSYRAAYNLACYYAGHAGDDDGYASDALERLAEAFRKAPLDEQTALGHWAYEDPSLAPLLRKHKREFDRVVRYYSDAPVPHKHEREPTERRTIRNRRRPLPD
jgi:hypothetical protein